MHLWQQLQLVVNRSLSALHLWTIMTEQPSQTSHILSTGPVGNMTLTLNSAATPGLEVILFFIPVVLCLYAWAHCLAGNQIFSQIADLLQNASGLPPELSRVFWYIYSTPYTVTSPKHLGVFLYYKYNTIINCN